VTDPAPLSWYLGLSAILFGLGAMGVLMRRNLIVIFMAIELMLNAVNLTFVTFARSQQAVDGHVIVFFVMAVAAAEAAVGLAIILQVFRSRSTVNADEDDAPMVTPDCCLRWMVFLPALGFLWNAIVGNRAPKTSAIVGPAAVGGAFVVAVISVPRLHGLEGGTGTARRCCGFRVELDHGRRLLADVAFGSTRFRDHGPRRHGDRLPDPRVLDRHMHTATPASRGSSRILNLLHPTAMLVLVLGDNSAPALRRVGGVGLCSYSHRLWYEVGSNGHRRAVHVNRIGDASFVLGLFLLVHAGRHAPVQEKAPELDPRRGWALPRSSACCSSAARPASRRRSRSSSGCPTRWPARHRCPR
jgi:NADH-quinone oxidoreductase subunit K